MVDITFWEFEIYASGQKALPEALATFDEIARHSQVR